MTEMRVFYSKTGDMKFISHLDTIRLMARAIKKASIPIWFTEGFNQHPYINFALPLSLGFESTSEAVDMRINDDMTDDEILKRLSEVAPEGMKITSVCEPVKKFSEIAFADFAITIRGDLADKLNAFLSKPEILVDKKTKKGGVKQIDLKEKIVKYNVSKADGNTRLDITLPAGTQENINPNLILNAFCDDLSVESIVRTTIYDSEMKIFA